MSKQARQFLSSVSRFAAERASLCGSEGDIIVYLCDFEFFEGVPASRILASSRVRFCS